MNEILFEVNWIGNKTGCLSFGAFWFLGISLWIMAIIKREKTHYEKTINGHITQAVDTFSAIWVGIYVLFITLNFKSKYVDTVVAYKLGQYCEVEGVVEDYVSNHGRGDDRCSIDGVEFSYSLGFSWGYCQTERWGVIKGNGQHLRVRYIPQSVGNVIVYIEQLDE